MTNNTHNTRNNNTATTSNMYGITRVSCTTLRTDVIHM